MSSSKETGFSILAKKNLREIYLFGHLEYDRETLAWEYERDKEEGLKPNLPQNYFPENDDKNKPKSTWASAASLFFFKLVELCGLSRNALSRRTSESTFE